MDEEKIAGMMLEWLEINFKKGSIHNIARDYIFSDEIRRPIEVVFTPICGIVDEASIMIYVDPNTYDLKAWSTPRVKYVTIEPDELIDFNPFIENFEIKVREFIVDLVADEAKLGEPRAKLKFLDEHNAVDMNILIDAFLESTQLSLAIEEVIKKSTTFSMSIPMRIRTRDFLNRMVRSIVRF